MYLKSIEVHGFKSFANKTLFEFHNGITCIVGPNGSGKSNVADAVRWVLGEQSSKQLRGSNMQDVIFSGTESRKPQGYASVAITFDNSDRHLNLDYNEVTVARRLYRSGESEYYLNQTQCRLRDVTELFYDTGIGKEGYSIIGQGQIDRILSGKPEDRRELFDEAAGIVKYKRRKAMAKKRLESEQANMVRLSDIMSELEKQVGPLERQSKTAREYLRLRDELKQYDVNAYVLESAKWETALQELERNLSIAEKDFEETTSASDALKSGYEQKQEAFNQLEELINGLRDKIAELQSQRQEREGEMNVLREQINTENIRRENTTQRLAVLEREIESYRQEITQQEQKRQQCSRDLYDTQVQEGKIRDQIGEIQGRLSAFQKALRDEQGKMITLLNEKSALVGELQKYDTMLEQAKTELAEQNRRFLESKTEESIWQKRVEEYKSAYEAVSTQKAQLQKQQDEALNRLETDRKRKEELQNRFYEQRRLHQVTVTQTESLRNLAERYEGYGNSIRRIMEIRDKNPGIHGVVADLIQVEQKYETAIETALGGSIQNIVTDTEQTAKQLIQYLKQGKLGRATFLPLDAIALRDEFTQKEVLKEKGVIGLAHTLVKCDAVYQKLIRFLLGRIVVTDTIDSAMKVSAKYHRSLRIVTLEGDLLNPGGSMTGGSFRNASNLLGRHRELEALEQRSGKEEAQLKTLSEELRTVSASVEVLEKDTQRARSVLQNLNLKETENRLRLREASQRVEEMVGSREHLCNEIRLQEEKIRGIRENHQKMQQSVQELDTRGDQSQNSANRNQESVDETIAKRDQLAEELNRLEMHFSGLEQQKQFVQENISRIKEEIEKRIHEQTQLNSTALATGETVDQKQVLILQAQKEVERLSGEMQQQETVLEEKIHLRSEANAALKGFFEKREELSARLSALDKDIFRMNNQKERQEGRLDDMANYLWEEYELRPSEAKSAFQENCQPLSELKAKINELKKSIRGLGNVNVNAIEEFKEVSERYTFMKTQYEDLIESEKSLQGVINELDIGMRKQFEEKFAEIRVEFDRVFKELFGGGKGTLELVEGEDIIEAGIRIISQPPGKKLQNMMQLSGGEKALTAISLLFAIQNLKPSPFCLLDEIEAALDDSNVGRFANYLHKLTENTQFIVITHRRGTMTSADRLYGITMQEKGVSTLISVNLIEQQLTQ